MLQKVKSYIQSVFKPTSIPHFERTVYWVQHFKPDADEALLIAAYSHDVERGLRKDQEKSKEFAKGERLTHHQEEGGRVMYNFLLENGAPKVMAERVKSLISKHEVGGNDDENLLKDADSVSFFESNAERMLTYIEKRGLSKEEIKWKFNWMFNRITSPKASVIAKPLYERVIARLE